MSVKANKQGGRSGTNPSGPEHETFRRCFGALKAKDWRDWKMFWNDWNVSWWWKRRLLMREGGYIYILDEAILEVINVKRYPLEA